MVSLNRNINESGFMDTQLNITNERAFMNIQINIINEKGLMNTY